VAVNLSFDNIAQFSLLWCRVASTKYDYNKFVCLHLLVTFDIFNKLFIRTILVNNFYIFTYSPMSLADTR
jgi:hypothetical protein